MKSKFGIGVLCFLGTLIVGDSFTSKTFPVRGESGSVEKPTEARGRLVVSRLSSMPLSFTQNQGQWGEKTKFRCDARGATFYFAANEVAYLFSRGTDEVIEEPTEFPNTGNKLMRPRYKREGLLVRARFVGANPDVEVTGEEMLSHKSNYFYGNEPSRWQTDVPNYSSVIYRDIYPGIDLKYYGDGRSLKYDFIIQPGTNPSVIRVQYENVDSLWVNSEGELVVATHFGHLVEMAPYMYQEIEGKKLQVSGCYTKIDWKCFGFSVEGEYDKTRPLVIDPELLYSTYLGGSGHEYGRGIAVDGSGSAYVTGYTCSSDFPTVNPYQGYQGDWDAFITKLSPSGSSLLYSTYLGGFGPDQGWGIAVDDSGSAYVTGRTGSSNFPTVNPYQGDQGGEDVFITKLSPSGSSLLYSTYLGGSGSDHGQGIAVDDSGSAYVTGHTYSSDFPTVSPYQGDQGDWDVFIAKLSPSGSSLLYSTYLGGSSSEYGRGIAVDGPGSAYVMGRTGSSDFPTVNPYQGDQLGSDAFVAKFGDQMPELPFIRGDADGNGLLSISDGLWCLRCQFVPGWLDSCECEDATDANDDGMVSIGDCLRILRKQFVPGWQDSIPPPCCDYPDSCGPDPTPDVLGCEEHPCMGGVAPEAKRVRSAR